jgi:hypothetical protein
MQTSSLGSVKQTAPMTKKGHLWCGLRLIVIASAVTLLSCASNSQSTVALLNNHASDSGHLLTEAIAPPDMRLQLEITFKLRNKKDLDALLAGQNDPHFHAIPLACPPISRHL